ncbi:MAG: hypothetical protein PHT88_00320 [Candidatus Moranbacteria bacterium]|nr:hypothetical protein [Candidatus Moranbacteria bacterium]
MLFNFSILFSSLLFLGGLELVIFQSEHVIASAMLITVLTLHASHRIGKGLFSGVIPLTFALSAVMLLYLVDSMMQRQWLIGLSFGVYYLAFLGIYRLRYYERDKTARGMVSFVVMATMFLFYASIYGLYLNFAVPIWGFMLAYCAVTALLSYQYFLLFDQTQTRRVRIYSLILGLSMAEVAWIINFWPFGYLTTGVVVLMFYYILWDLVQSYFLKDLSKKRIFVHLVLFGFLIGMVLTSTRWVPVA